MKRRKGPAGKEGTGIGEPVPLLKTAFVLAATVLSLGLTSTSVAATNTGVTWLNPCEKTNPAQYWSTLELKCKTCDGDKVQSSDGLSCTCPQYKTQGSKKIPYLRCEPGLACYTGPSAAATFVDLLTCKKCGCYNRNTGNVTEIAESSSADCSSLAGAGWEQMSVSADGRRCIPCPTGNQLAAISTDTSGVS
jgi:hypothetical protein